MPKIEIECPQWFLDKYVNRYDFEVQDIRNNPINLVVKMIPKKDYKYEVQWHHTHDGWCVNKEFDKKFETLEEAQRYYIGTHSTSNLRQGKRIWDLKLNRCVVSDISKRYCLQKKLGPDSWHSGGAQAFDVKENAFHYANELRKEYPGYLYRVIDSYTLEVVEEKYYVDFQDLYNERNHLSHATGFHFNNEKEAIDKAKLLYDDNFWEYKYIVKLAQDGRGEPPIEVWSTDELTYRYEIESKPKFGPKWNPPVRKKPNVCYNDLNAAIKICDEWNRRSAGYWHRAVDTENNRAVVGGIFQEIKRYVVQFRKAKHLIWEDTPIECSDAIEALERAEKHGRDYPEFLIQVYDRDKEETVQAKLFVVQNQPIGIAHTRWEDMFEFTNISKAQDCLITLNSMAPRKQSFRLTYKV